jgi:hypothetical protein
VAWPSVRRGKPRERQRVGESLFLPFAFMEVPMVVAHPEYSADMVRGGVIILRRPWQKVVFMSGLFGGVLLLLVALFFGL